MGKVICKTCKSENLILFLNYSVRRNEKMEVKVGYICENCGEIHVFTKAESDLQFDETVKIINGLIVR